MTRTQKLEVIESALVDMGIAGGTSGVPVLKDVASLLGGIIKMYREDTWNNRSEYVLDLAYETAVSWMVSVAEASTIPEGT